MTDEDKKIIDLEWEKIVREKKSAVYSIPRGLGTLYDTQNNVFTYDLTDFKTNAAAINTFSQRRLSPEVYKNLRTSVFGCSLHFKDGLILAQRRGPEVWTLEGKLDSSVAGYVHIKEKKIIFSDAIFGRLKSELGILPEEI
ncbi:MAG: hypothetical protein AABX86_01300, partial [Nanoarchaeota archaeon]